MTGAPVRVGAIGLGLIAQVVHLPDLRRLPDRFTVTHVCDLSPTVATTIAGRLVGPPQALAAAIGRSGGLAVGGEASA